MNHHWFRFEVLSDPSIPWATEVEFSPNFDDFMRHLTNSDDVLYLYECFNSPDLRQLVVEIGWVKLTVTIMGQKRDAVGQRADISIYHVKYQDVLNPLSDRAFSTSKLFDVPLVFKTVDELFGDPDFCGISADVDDVTVRITVMDAHDDNV